MNTSILCALALCLVLSLVHQSEAGACFTVQRRKCNRSGSFCWTVNVRICNRRKRSLDSQVKTHAWRNEYIIVVMVYITGLLHAYHIDTMTVGWRISNGTTRRPCLDAWKLHKAD